MKSYCILFKLLLQDRSIIQYIHFLQSKLVIKIWELAITYAISFGEEKAAIRIKDNSFNMV